MIDGSLRFVWANTACMDRFERAHGLRIASGTQFGDVVSARDLVAWRERYDRAFAGEAFVVEHTFRWADGARLYDVSFTPAPRGEVPGVLVSARDRTYERELVAGLGALAGALSVVSCTIALDGTFLAVHGDPVEHLGYVGERWTGRRLDTVFARTDAERLRGELGRLRGGAMPEPIEVALRGANGSVPCRARFARIEHRRETLVILSRIESSNHAQLAAVERLASLGLLTASVAHEVNSPLSYALINVEHAIDVLGGDESHAETRRILFDALDGLRRVTEIVRDLRTLSSQRQDRRDLIDVRLTVERALRLARGSSAGGIEIRTEYEPVPSVEGTEGRLGQVFVNLFRNALQAVRELEPARRRVMVRTRTDDAYVIIEVADSGPGIPLEVRDRLFQLFATGRRDGGTGIGLWISHRIVSEHGGELLALDEPGGGACFRVRLPIAEARANAPSRRPTAPAMITASRTRVLIVDDEPKLGEAIARMLRHDHVDHAGDGAEAIALLASGARYDVIVTDLSMPILGGLALRAEIAKRWPGMERRVILMTGALTSVDEEGLGDVQVEMLEKPFDRATLVRAIAAVMHAAASEPEPNED